MDLFIDSLASESGGKIQYSKTDHFAQKRVSAFIPQFPYRLMVPNDNKRYTGAMAGLMIRQPISAISSVSAANISSLS